MIGLGEFALGVIYELLASIIQEGVNYTVLPFFQRRKIDRRIEDATAEVVEPLLPFLSQEGIPEDKQRRLIQTCVDELRPLAKQPERLFQGSLDGNKIFEELYAERDLPQVVVEDGTKDIYALLCPRIATLLCKIPAAVKDWESEAWSENFRRFDEITTQMQVLFGKVDELTTLPTREADATLTLVRRALAQKVRLELDLTGLRADRPLAGRFDDFFVHPLIGEDREEGSRAVGTPDQSFDQFVRRSKQAIVIGAPGAGKSTWSRWLHREALSARWAGISIRVELRRFPGEPLLSLPELIREAVGRHFSEEITADRIRRWLTAKKVVFILDGFDEISPTERDEVRKWIEELGRAAPGCPFVLTSRPLTTDHLVRLGISWQRWTIEPFDEERIIDYIRRWYTHTPLLLEGNREVDALALAKNWRTDPTIGPLTGNPLLLSTLLLVNHLDGKLPSGRSQLYRRYVEGMLGLWDDRRKVRATPLQLSLEQKRQILRGLALRMSFQGREQLGEPATVNLVQSLLQRLGVSLPVEDVLAALRERSGLIVGPGIYSFVHKSVAEYLVAEAILQGDQRDVSGRRVDRFWLFEQRDNDRWDAVTFLWAGLAPVTDVESFIAECIEAETLDLACGILDDQYERIPPEIRQRLLLEVFRKEWKLTRLFRIENIRVEWQYSWSEDLPLGFLSTPTFHLRSLSASSEFAFLVMRAVEDGTITWSDRANAQEEIRDLIWMGVASSPRDIGDWMACLTSSCPESSVPAAWLYWAVESLVTDVICGTTKLDLEAFIGAYKEACPHIRGLVPLALMSSALRSIEVESYEPSEIRRILEVLLDSNDGEIQLRWLSGTRRWRLVGAEPMVVDLLTAFVERMEFLAEQGTLKRDATYRRATSFVEELRERRDAPHWLSPRVKNTDIH